MKEGLYADSIVRSFGLRKVLSDVVISCQIGEVVGFLGRNGSGKSTLLKIILGCTKADHKFVKVAGKPIKSLFQAAGQIRYLPQDNFLPAHVSMQDIISVFCTRERAKKLLLLDLIRPHAQKKSHELSGGERRIVEILMMIYSEADYLLFDEPFNGLAPLHIEIIKNLIRENSSKKGFIITDHDYRNVLDVSTRVILMHDGAVKTINHKTELIDWGYLTINNL